MKFYEDRFQRISSATGMDNPEAIINKFFLKDVVKADLEAEIDAKNKRLEALKVERVMFYEEN
jgi:hypothetical protein